MSVLSVFSTYVALLSRVPMLGVNAPLCGTTRTRLVVATKERFGMWLACFTLGLRGLCVSLCSILRASLTYVGSLAFLASLFKNFTKCPTSVLLLAYGDQASLAQAVVFSSGLHRVFLEQPTFLLLLSWH